MSKTKDPEFVPVVEANDFCRNKLDDSEGRHCLMGWVRHIFGVEYPVAVIDAIKKEIEIKCDTTFMFNSCIAQYNDDPINPLHDLADVFNAAMRKLGYTEITDA